MNKLIETIKTPQDSVNDDSVIVTQIFVKNGQKVSEDEVLAEIETSKALVEIIAVSAGFVKLLCSINQEVLIGETLFEIYSDEIGMEDNKNPEKKEAPSNKISEAKENGSSDALNNAKINSQFSKSAKELIAKSNLDPTLFKGKQFVTAKNIQEILNPGLSVPKSIDKKTQNPLKTNSGHSSTNSKLLSKQKLNETQYLSSVNSIGLVSRLTIAIRSNLAAIGKAQNFITSTPLPLIVHEVSRLLIKYPNINSFFELNQQIFHENITVGIAMDNGINGLKVAGISNCDAKNLYEIEEEITDLSLKYNDNKLSLKEISSSTFTITDLFSTGVTNFHPLINYNNSAILGICGLKDNSFNLELAFDHRISNGLEVSKFLNDLKSRLENRINVNGIATEELSTVECNVCLRTVADDLNGEIYFLKVLNSKMNGHICSNCFNGF